MHSVKIEQLLGCWIEEITEKLDISKAGELLSTRKQKKYTYALRNEDQATLGECDQSCVSNIRQV